MTNPPAEEHGNPVSAKRIEVCLQSASFWVDELPRYADRQQQRADSWAIAAGILSAITSLSIWPLLEKGSDPPQLVLVSTVALLAAICALVPRVKNYAELAGQARELSSRYGSLKGDLIDLANTKPLDQERARVVVTEFQATKEKKDALRGLPDRAKGEIRLADLARRVAEARRIAADAERTAELAKGAVTPP